MVSPYVSALAGNHEWVRKAADFYATPPEAAFALMRYLELHGDGLKILEPACGTGDMAAVLEHFGHEVIAKDLFDRGYGEVGSNFLEDWTQDQYDWIITNPPFALAEEFIRHACCRGKNVAMLLKSNFWNTAEHKALFMDFTPQWVFPLTWRPVFLPDERGTAPMMDCCWSVWEGTMKTEMEALFDHPPTVFFPLNKPDIGDFVFPLSVQLAKLHDALGSNFQARRGL